MNNTQPICEDCWNEQHKNQPPFRTSNNNDETCHFCGKITSSGIYIRAIDQLTNKQRSRLHLLKTEINTLTNYGNFLSFQRFKLTQQQI